MRLYWKLKTHPAYSRFERASKNPQAAQESVWNETWALCRQGDFWPSRRAGVAVPRLSDFDITNYEFYRETVERDIEGKISTITGRPIRFVTRSSATSSNKPKLMPVSDEFIAQFMDPLYAYWTVLMSQFPGFMKKRILQTVSTSFQTRTSSGLEIGLGSYLLYTVMPKFQNRTFGYPYKVLESAELFGEFGPYYALADDVCAVHGLSPARILDLILLLQKSFERTLPYLEGNKTLPDSLPRRRVSRERVESLKQIFGSGTVTLRGIWPSMEHLRVWKSSSGVLQLKLLAPHLDPGLAVIDHCYCSSEGAYTVPVPPDLYGGAVNCGSIILEFTKAGSKPEARNLMPAWELKPGEEYEVFITNKLGFIRYQLGDVVRCNGFYNSVPIIEFLRRSGMELTLGAGLAILTETQVIESMEESALNMNSPWVLGRNEHGNGLVYYHVDEVSNLDGELLKFNQRLEQNNFLYGRSIKARTLIPPKSRKLPPDHKLWNKASNSQVKPKVFTNLNGDEI